MHRIFSAFLGVLRRRQTVPVSPPPRAMVCGTHTATNGGGGGGGRDNSSFVPISLRPNTDKPPKTVRPSPLYYMWEAATLLPKEEEECPSQSAAALLHHLLRKRSGIHRRSLAEAMPKTLAVARSAAVYFSLRLSKNVAHFSPPSLLFPPPVCVSFIISFRRPPFVRLSFLPFSSGGKRRSPPSLLFPSDVVQ